VGRDDICTVARRIDDYRAITGRGLRGLFKSVDIDEEDLGHLARHASQLADLEPVSFAWGLLFGLMLAREQAPLEELTDHDLSELLQG
jgi:hypothetical protein